MKIQYIAAVILLLLALPMHGNAERIVKNQSFGGSGYNYVLFAKPELGIINYDWLVDGQIVKNNTEENWYIKKWNESDLGLHNVTVIGKNITGNNIWYRWAINITPVYYPDYEIWITNWSRDNYTLRTIVINLTYDPGVIQINTIASLSETGTGEIYSYLNMPLTISRIDNARGVANITVITLLPIYSDRLPGAYVAKINYSLRPGKIVPMQRFDFDMQLWDWSNNVHKLNIYGFTGPNPPVNMKPDNEIDIFDLVLTGQCIDTGAGYPCEKKTSMSDMNSVKQSFGQAFSHNWH